ncbi:hypothetical protein E1B28_005047 [Marasmius oreades]|uniref:Uncharacterized protein n=1 Tax=Marasmius oreades TaxID=181124 RepID=A0A9P7UZY8_9AGAR|nr:uncharacterized protein E1B28_005047 [Marasmius oreades]KAG7097727.1 hypothetical protein E1B28_005047 [Marasmius oreades]
MADMLHAYSLLTASSTRSHVSDVLQTIIDTLPSTIEQSSRAELIQLLIKDLRTAGSKTSRLTQKDASHALLALKTLGKSPEGSEYLVTPSGLSALLAIATNMKDDHEATRETLRCIANTMLLFDEARYKFVTKEVGGGDICVGMLHKARDPQHLFILSRILFLSTTSPSTFLLSLVEDKRHGQTITEIISTKLDVLLARLLAGAKLAREAMSELLKFTFNLLLHYPKLISVDKTHSRTSTTARSRNSSKHDDNDRYWSPKLDGLLPPLLRVYHSLPTTFPSPLSAPLTHVIHSLIYMPVSEKSLIPIWLGSSGSSPTRRSPSYPQSNGHTHNYSRPMSIAVPNANGRPLTSYTQVPSQQPSLGVPRSRHSIDSPPSPQDQTFSIGNTTPPKQTTLDKALSVLSLSVATGKHRRSPSPLPPHKGTGPGMDVVQRTLDLLDVSFAHYMPGCVEPYSLGVKERVRMEYQVQATQTQAGSASPYTSSWKTATMGSISSSSGLGNGSGVSSPATALTLTPSINGSGTPELSDILTPLVTLLTRLCFADCRTRIRVANWLIPLSLFLSSSWSSSSSLPSSAHQDRYSPTTTNTPLYKQQTFLGRCLRILLCTHPTIAKLKEVVGELFWVASGEDAWVLSSRLGYPLVKELLASKGVMSEPTTPAPTPLPKGPEIGFKWEGGVMDIRRMPAAAAAAAAGLNEEMTEEEKEGELEKMFGWLDRLEMSGRSGPGMGTGTGRRR